MSGRAGTVTITVLTGFPALLGSLDAEGVIRGALDRKKAALRIVNLRDYTDDRHRTIDDQPYGGGPGMVLRVEPVARALAALPPAPGGREVVLLSPQGRRLTQDRLSAWSGGCDLVVVCGRYKAVDERVRTLVDGELSLGDFVLSGGELAAMVIIDGILRLIPGVLSDLDSALTDSFSAGILDCAYYTRPEEFRGRRVPPVLLSGNHAAIARWRREDALARTLELRPDLFDRAALDNDDRRFLRSRGWTEQPQEGGRKS